MNYTRDEIRGGERVAPAAVLDTHENHRAVSPRSVALGPEAVERFEAALARLRPEDRGAIVARMHMDGPYEKFARALGKPSADAARMAVSRALLRLAQEMSRGR
jgi:DNA-directed RNA polymerase specialized sigma24 family protein